MKTPIVLQGVGLVEQITVTEWLFEAGEKVKCYGANACKGQGHFIPARLRVKESPELVPADAVLGYVDDQA